MLGSTQSLINELNMFLHHMELANTDIGVITETWVNNKIDQHSMISQAKQAGYTTISHGHTNREGERLMFIHKSG